jgi:hypothetical protein
MVFEGEVLEPKILTGWPPEIPQQHYSHSEQWHKLQKQMQEK